VSTVSASRPGEARSPSRRLTLSGTLLSTSCIGAGTHALHRLLSSHARQRLLHSAHELGVRHFDTAPSYGAGLAELELGRFAAGRRSELVLTSKFGIPAGRLAANVPGWLYAQMALRLAAKAAGLNKGPQQPPRRDFSASVARASLEGTLRRLKTDHVDVLYLHEPQTALLGESDALLRELEALKVSGKVRWFGLSGNPVECARVAAAYPLLAQVLQVELLADTAGVGTPADGPPAAIRFCEFSAPPRTQSATGPFAQMLQRLRAAPYDCVLVLSTDSIDGLRKVVDSV
jgi:aryl-alcohol dehydrogenase-like predicted oxidoreductase